MPVDIFEMADTDNSQTGKNASVKKAFMVTGTIDEPTVRRLVLFTAPQFYEGVLNLQATTQAHLGNGVWLCSASYGFRELQTNNNPGAGGTGGSGGSGGSNDGHQPGANDPVGPHISGSIGSRQQHFTSSLQTTDSDKLTGDSRGIPDHKHSIGVSKEGVEGCDWPVPEFRWSEAWLFLPQFVTWGYLQRLRSYHGRVNGVGTNYDGTFRAFPKGEARFEGVDFEAQGLERVRMTFHFFAEENITAYKLTNDFANGVNKSGHEYLWVEYEDKAGTDYISKQPRAVFVEEVGRPGNAVDNDGFRNRIDFRLIGIGA